MSIPIRTWPTVVDHCHGFTGDFVIAWESNEDGSTYGIYAQRYAATGAVEGSEFGVNAYTTNSQEFSYRRHGRGRRFDRRLESYSQDGSSFGGYAQRYNAYDVAQGSNFQVNTYTTGGQAFPAVAMDAAGDFVVTWQSNGEDGSSYGVYAQRYGFSTAPAVSTSSTALVYAANSGARAISSSLALADGESTVIYGATVSISSGYVSGEDVLGFTSQNGITGSFNAGTGTLTLSGTATVTNYQTALASITYTDAAHDASLNDRTVSFTVSDGIVASPAATQTVAPQGDVAVQLFFSTQPPSSATAGSGFGFAMVAEDAQGFTDPDFSGGISVAILNNPGGSTLGGVATVSATSGVAVFSGLSLNKVGANYTLLAYSSGLTSATSSGLTVTPGTATQLLVSVQPPTSVTAGKAFGLTVAAEDSYGNVVPTFSGSVTAAIGNNPGASALGGTATASISHGLAAFSNLTLNKSGAGYTLQFVSGSLSTATSNNISIASGVATQLLIIGQPPSVVPASNPFTMTVAAEDALGNVATSFVGSITAALATNPGSSSLGGTLTVSTTGGVATFSGLTLNNAGTGYTLRATSTSLASTITNAITVSLAAATFTDNSPSLNLGLNTDSQVTVVSTGTTYQFTLASGIWSGINDAN